MHIDGTGQFICHHPHPLPFHRSLQRHHKLIAAPVWRFVKGMPERNTKRLFRMAVCPICRAPGLTSSDQAWAAGRLFHPSGSIWYGFNRCDVFIKLFKQRPIGLDGVMLLDGSEMLRSESFSSPIFIVIFQFFQSFVQPNTEHCSSRISGAVPTRVQRIGVFAAAASSTERGPPSHLEVTR